MIQQLQQPCNECSGNGEMIDPRDRCSTCNGQKLVPETKVLEVHIEKGSKWGEKIEFYGEGEQSTEVGVEPGDVIIILKPKETEATAQFSTWQRADEHLVVKKEITLLEALTGFEFFLPHLSGKVLRVKSEPNHVVKPGDLMVVENEGMPIKGSGGLRRGNLFLQFDVKFPTPSQLQGNKKMQKLREILPQPEDLPMLPREVEQEEVVARTYDLPKDKHGRTRHTMEDDEEASGARTAHCSGTIM